MASIDLEVQHSDYHNEEVLVILGGNYTANIPRSAFDQWDDEYFYELGKRSINVGQTQLRHLEYLCDHRNYSTVILVLKFLAEVGIDY